MFFEKSTGEKAIASPGARVRGNAAALDPVPELVWVHLYSIDEDARSWLAEHARLSAQAVEALTAPETRPRCDQWEGGALVNLRGRTAEEATAGADPLASLRIWATRGRVFSITRTQLCALGAIEECVAADRIHDPGDLIAECAVAMGFGASSEDIARSCHAHPTLAEAVKEAALAVDGRAIHF